MPTQDWKLRLTVRESAYVLGVAVLATLGFSTASTTLIILAALVALPASIMAIPPYYLVVALLALTPGASPSSSTGSGSCSAIGECQTLSTGDSAAWFTLTAAALGVLALVAAAVLNVVFLRLVVARRRSGRDAQARTGGT